MYIARIVPIIDGLISWRRARQLKPKRRSDLPTWMPHSKQRHRAVSGRLDGTSVSQRSV